MIPLYDENKIKNKFAFGTLLLVLANIVVFFYTFQNINFYSEIFGFRPADLWNGQFYTIFTAMFLHANLWHLLGNMLFLWVFGENLESRLGTIRFILFYLICGAIAAVVYALVGSMGSLTVIGASGAISSILGGYLILFPKNKIKSIIPIVFFWTLATLPAALFIVIWFLYQFFSLGFENMTLIAYSAHIAGFIAGLVLIKKFASRKKFF